MMGPLFAQAARGGGANDPLGGIPVGVFIAVVLVVGLVALTIAICFLLTLSKALSRCHPENRTMEPAMVWLNLVPFLNIVWEFITVIRVSESLKNEFYDRGYRSQGDYGKGLGLGYCILGLLGIIPFIGPVFSFGALVCGIMYWVKIAGFSKQLAEDTGADDYDDEDDRPRKKSRRDEEDDYEDDDRPRKKTRAADDDYEDDDRPKKKPWNK